MLVEGPNHLNRPLHDLRSIAAAAGFAYQGSFGRLTPDSAEQITPPPAPTFRTRFPDDKLEQSLMSLQIVLPTPEQRRKEQEDARIEPEEWDV